MGRKSLIAVVAGIVLLLGLAVGAYAYDSSKSDEIAEGVRVGEIDLGGLSEDEARTLLEQELVAPLEDSIVVKYKGDKFTLSKNQLDVSADIDGILAEASAASREGSLPSRVLRYLSGDEVDEDIEPVVGYDEIEVGKFVDGVAANLNQDPINATVEPSGSSLAAIQGREGVEVDVDDLAAQIEGAISQTGEKERVVHPTVTTLKPEVTKADLADRYPTYIAIDRETFKLRFFESLELVKTYTIALGAAGYDTPAGVYEITDKTVDPNWYVPDAEWAGDLAGTIVPGGSPENPLVNRWMGFYDGAGIHGTNDVASLGSNASHGCVRMDPDEVIELYDEVDVGTPIYIG